MDRDGNILLAKTSMMGKWELVRVNRQTGIVTKHIKELKVSEFEEIFKDFAEYKLKQLGGDGFTLTCKDKNLKIIVDPLEEVE
jgi:hypothetical protein